MERIRRRAPTPRTAPHSSGGDDVARRDNQIDHHLPYEARTAECRDLTEDTNHLKLEYITWYLGKCAKFIIVFFFNRPWH
jgi:hypothetical protein